MLLFAVFTSELFNANGREKTGNILFTAYTRDTRRCRNTQLFDVLYITIRSIPKPQSPKKTGYLYENQFYNLGFTNGVR